MRSYAVPSTVTARVSFVPAVTPMPDCEPRATVPVDEAAWEDWVTSMVCDPSVSPVPAAKLANPSAPPWDTRNEGSESTIWVVEATVPEETSELAVANCLTTNCSEPAGVPGAAVAVARLVSDEVAWRASQPEEVARLAAWVCSAIRSLLICWYSATLELSVVCSVCRSVSGWTYG